MPNKSIEIINYNGTEYEVGIQSLATSEKKGLMSPEDKDKLENMLVSSVSGNDPISVSNTDGTATISHNDSGVTANTYGVTAATGLTPGFGGTFSVPGFTVNAKGHVTAAGAHNVTIPTTLAASDKDGLMSKTDKANFDLGVTIAGNTVAIGGSLTASTLRTSLGLSNAMHFIGIATVAITDGSTTNPTISGYTFGTNGASAQKGDVVIDKDSAYEFVWTGSKWERLGPDGSYALADHIHDNATAQKDGFMSAGDKTKLDGMSVYSISGTAPISVTNTSGAVSITHATSGPSTSGNTSKGDTSNQTPGFGGTFKVTSETVDKFGHITALAEHTVTIPNATATTGAAGLMSAADKEKLDGVAANAKNTTISATTPIVASASTGAVTLTHATAGPSTTADTSKGDTSNQTPSWGGTFKVTSGTVDKYGHTKTFAEHTVTIPNAAATTGAAGLMSATDKQKLDGIAENANNYSLPTASTTVKGGVKVGTGLTVSNEVLNHSNAVTAQTTQAVYPIKIDAQGHISAYGTAITSMAPTAHTHARTDIGLSTDAVAGNLDSVTRPMVGSAASNKSFNLPAAAIVVEYSTDGGSTWTDYGATDAQKRALFSETRAANFYLGKASAKANNKVNNQLRVTIEPTDRYTSFDAVYIWMSTQGNTVVMDLERSTIGAKNTFTSVFTGQSITGWSGNNIRYFPQGQFGGGTSKTTNNYKYRLTFRQTAINSNYASAMIQDIRFYGLNVWSSPNNMVSKNHIYTWDNDLNTTFPAKVAATTFEGNLDWSYIQNKPTLGTLAGKSTIGDHTVTTPTGATSRTADVALNTTTVNSITAVGTLPSLTVTSISVVTGGSKTSIPNISKKTVVTATTVTKATYSNGILTFTEGSVTTGDSVTVGAAIEAYTSLTIGNVGSASAWNAGTLPTKGSDTTVATSIKTQPTFTVTTQSTTLSHSIS